MAIFATIVAVASLMVSVYETRTTRHHSRLSVRPLLHLQHTWRKGQTAGLRLTNSGLGPAIVTRTVLTVDGERLGEYDKPNVDRVRDMLAARPSAVAWGERAFLKTDYDLYLLSLDNYDPESPSHLEFRNLITRRFSLEIHYESLYGGEDYMAVFHLGEPTQR